MNTFDCLIPVPQRVDFSDKDTLTIAEIKNFYIAGAFCDFTAEIEELFSFFGFVINHTARQDDAQLVIFQAAMPPEGFRINIFSDRISITAADSAGLRYAIEAMRQMIFAAAICGPSAANLFYVFCIQESTLLALFMPSGNVRNRAPGRYRRSLLHAGAIIRKHPVWQQFPAEGFADWQFFRMMDSSCSMVHDRAMPEFQPLLELIPSFKRIRRKSMLSEYKVGKGRLICSSLKLQKDDPAGSWLKKLLLDYLAAKNWTDAPEWTPENLCERLHHPVQYSCQYRKIDAGGRPIDD